MFGMSDPSLTFGTSHQREPLAATKAHLHRKRDELASLHSITSSARASTH
jgi:hypothetical protein